MTDTNGAKCEVCGWEVDAECGCDPMRKKTVTEIMSLIVCSRCGRDYDIFTDDLAACSTCKEVTPR